ncbi:MAG: E3 binding domain-containing protein, partial [Planctomycetota bacterium]|nr:E3 binding domain-containing protein [Planctomycetota bacterium]
MAVDITIPSPGESISEVSLSGWLKEDGAEDGAYVEKDELLAEIESDKATLELRAPAAGALKIATKKGDGIKVGAVVAAIDTSVAKPAGVVGMTSAPSALGPAGANAGAGTSAKTEEPARVSGVAKKVAAEKGVNAAALAGTGPSGRVMKDDVLSAAASTSTPSPAAAPATTTETKVRVAVAATPGSRGTRREKMTKLRQKIAERLVHAQHSAAMLTTFNECDMTEIMR